MNEFKSDASPKVSHIVMKVPEIRALLKGRKSQARRILEIQPPPCTKGYPRLANGEWGIYTDRPNAGPYKHIGKCPFGEPGTLLWVQETWHRIPGNTATVIHRASCENGSEQNYKWISAFHMPPSASRLTLELTDVRIHRLQDISEVDAISEGAEWRDFGVDQWGNKRPGWNMDWTGGKNKDHGLSTARYAFANYFETIHNGKNWELLSDSQLVWNINPFVWALSFTVHQENIDTFLSQRRAA